MSRSKPQLELFDEESALNLPSLPKDWRWVTIGDIALVQGGIQKGKKRKPEDLLREVPYLRVANVQRGYLDLSNVKTIEATEGEIERLRLQPGDILFNEGGDRDKLGRGWIWSGQIPDCIHQNHVFRARLVSSQIFPRYVSWYANSAGRRYFFAHGKQTTNLASLNLTRLKAFPVPLSPSREQEAIVDAADEYLSKLDAAVAGLERVQANLKRYRASVLKAAVEGRLVPTEAELARAEGRDYEPASMVLERVLTERRHRWEQTKLATMQAKGKTPRNDKWKAKYKEPAAPDTSKLPALPDGWCWATVEQLVSPLPRSITDGPFGSNLKSAHYTAEGPRVVRLQNIGDAVWRDAKAHISHDHYLRLIKHAVFPGDIVVASLGEELPRACMVPNQLGPAIVKADCIRLKVNDSICSPEFVMYALCARPTRTRTKELVHGIGRPRIGLASLREILIPLPPLPEQQRIVDNIEQLMSAAKTSSGSIDSDLIRCQRLRQSILKWAFEGKLVDQDPTDEPASELLARIRAQREAESAKNEPKRRKPRKKRTTSK